MSEKEKQELIHRLSNAVANEIKINGVEKIVADMYAKILVLSAKNIVLQKAASQAIAKTKNKDINKVLDNMEKDFRSILSEDVNNLLKSLDYENIDSANTY